MLKRLAKYVYAFYLFHTGLRKRVGDIKKQKSIIAIFDHDPTPQEFEKYIKWLKKKGFAFVNLEELIEVLEGRKSINESNIWFTLDDGWRNNIMLLPILEKHNIPITLFIPTYAVETGFYRDTLEQVYADDLPLEYDGDFRKLYDIPNSERTKIDKPLYEKAKEGLPREAITAEELKRLSDHPLISIGLHTHSHPVLSQCTAKEIETEVIINKEKLIEYTAADSKILAIPYGTYNEHTIENLKKCGIQYVATSDHGVIDNETMTGILPRNGIAKSSFYENCCRMLNFWYPNVEKLNRLFKF